MPKANQSCGLLCDRVNAVNLLSSSQDSDLYPVRHIDLLGLIDENLGVPWC
jgi:hypothetical protein